MTAIARVCRVTVVHHTPSPALQVLLESVVEGVGSGARELEGNVRVITRPALSAGAIDVLDSDALILGTPANIGYMSGALKHFFDTVYYPCLSDSAAMPVAGYVHGNDSVEGAVNSISRITGALRWRPIQPWLEFTGPPVDADLDACRDLGRLAAAAALGQA